MALIMGQSRDRSLSMKELGVGVHNRTEKRWETEHEPIGGGAGMDTGKVYF